MSDLHHCTTVRRRRSSINSPRSCVATSHYWRSMGSLEAFYSSIPSTTCGTVAVDNYTDELNYDQFCKSFGETDLIILQKFWRASIRMLTDCFINPCSKDLNITS
ncbi:hypothetical protein K7X08_004530 [Anisodus acutangulus]|uniref:Uncharacterized protein n=1 Tax=Anisodus acutangulus TaxID=402998 RepID=A0A9Q1MFA5_9SOLA|nr:hypothetical protein K7X08_004530 [Anisodus acutangulus]